MVAVSFALYIFDATGETLTATAKLNT